jgi:phage FluMu protein Com
MAGKTIKEDHEKQQEYQVRCNACTKLLGMFKMAVGVIKCPRCNHTQQIDIGGTAQTHRAA